MSVSGNWVGHYSWRCNGNYSQFDIAFNADGTFTGTQPGKWAQQDGFLLLSFDNGPARYGATVLGNAGVGAMSTFTGISGCWYLVKAATAAGLGAPAIVAEARQSHDAAGHPT